MKEISATAQQGQTDWKKVIGDMKYCRIIQKTKKKPTFPTTGNGK